MILETSSGDDGECFYVKGHVDLELFMRAVSKESGQNENILKQKPEHIWMRKCHDFTGQYGYLMIRSKPNRQGSFKVTWIEEY